MGLEYIRNDGKYKQLCCEERGKIEAYLTLKYSISKIAEMMKRSKSTIGEEIRGNSFPKERTST
ncbi:MAG: helix-turn-helix domain-containing protein [Alphaproteobacteria bacterium]|nr:helix-turn-helix domain-containing protein [Alphaproteobacteria bacterium]